MAQVDVSVNGRAYLMACEDGQEDHLRGLGTELDRRVRELVQNFGQVGDARLMVMVALMLMDELHDAESAGQGHGGGAEADRVANLLVDVAQRIERVADQLSVD